MEETGSQRRANRADVKFAENLVVGTVFEDRNGNGVREPDERGLPGVRVTSGEGVRAETDRYGRFHLARARGGRGLRGRNFILKVDPSTVPAGMAFTTPNPAVHRFGFGAPMRLDFGVRRSGESASSPAVRHKPVPPSASRPATAKDEL